MLHAAEGAENTGDGGVSSLVTLQHTFVVYAPVPVHPPTCAFVALLSDATHTYPAPSAPQLDEYRQSTLVGAPAASGETPTPRHAFTEYTCGVLGYCSACAFVLFESRNTASCASGSPLTFTGLLVPLRSHAPESPGTPQQHTESPYVLVAGSNTSACAFVKFETFTIAARLLFAERLFQYGVQSAFTLHASPEAYVDVSGPLYCAPPRALSVAPTKSATNPTNTSRIAYHLSAVSIINALRRYTQAPAEQLFSQVYAFFTRRLVFPSTVLQ